MPILHCIMPQHTYSNYAKCIPGLVHSIYRIWKINFDFNWQTKKCIACQWIAVHFYMLSESDAQFYGSKILANIQCFDHRYYAQKSQLRLSKIIGLRKSHNRADLTWFCGKLDLANTPRRKNRKRILLVWMYEHTGSPSHNICDSIQMKKRKSVQQNSSWANFLLRYDTNSVYACIRVYQYSFDGINIRTLQ